MGYFKPKDWDKNDDLAAGVERAIEKSKSDMQDLREKRWRRAYLYFHCKHDPTAFGKAVEAASREDGYPYDSSLFRPLLAQQVLTATPRLRAALLGGDPPFRAKPDVDTMESSGGNSPEWAECDKLQHYINNVWHKQIAFPELCGPLVQDADLYGTQVVKLEQYRRAELQWEMVPNSPDQEWTLRAKEFNLPGGEGREAVPVQEWKIVEDRIKLTVIPLWNFFPDTRGRSIRGKHDNQPCRYAGELASATVDEIISRIMADPIRGWQYPKAAEPEGRLGELARRAGNKQASPEEMDEFEDLLRKWLEPVSGSVDDEDDWQRKMQAEARKLGGTVTPETKEERDVVRLIEFYTAGIDPWYLLKAGKGNGIILRKLRGLDHPSLFCPLPYVLCKPRPLLNELFGLGKGELLEALQHEVNSWSNLYLTSFKESLYGITVLDNAAGVTSEMLLGQPKRTLDVNNLNGVPVKDAIHYIERPDPGPAAYAVLGDLRNEFNMTGGATDYLQGASPQLAGGTVRGYALAVEQGSQRWTYEAACLAANCAEMGYVIQALAKQYLTKAKYVEVTGGDATGQSVAIDPMVVWRKYQIFFDFRPVVVNEAMQLANHIQEATIAGAWPEYNRKRWIVDHAKMRHAQRPEEYALAQYTDVQMENMWFAQRGEFPAPPRPSDDHLGHHEQHEQMRPVAQAMGDAAVYALNEHQSIHRQYAGGGGGAPEAGAGEELAAGPPGEAGPPGQAEPQMPMAEATPGNQAGEFPYDLEGMTAGAPGMGAPGD